MSAPVPACHPARIVRVAALTAAAIGAAIATTPASAHTMGPDFSSVFRGISPAIPGVSVRIEEDGARIALVNHSDRSLVILGYQGEPYIRFRPGGIVERNSRSVTTSLHQAAAGSPLLAASAFDDRGVPARWTIVGRHGRFSWHDQRIQWVGSDRPANVTDVNRRTRISDWSIPMRIESRATAIRGTLFWIGRPKPAPSWPLLAFVGTVVAAGISSMLLNRRHRARLTRARAGHQQPDRGRA